MGFSNIIGQKSIITALEKAWEKQKISHAYLFEGPDGIGKKTVAMAFAESIMCSERRNHIDACGHCDNCTMFRVGTHPDFHFFSTDNDTIKVDEIRDLFDDIYITSHYSDKKVYIIDKAEKMNTQAQNCILKTLEEPPEDVIIILLTANSEMLLETILSRVIKYSFERYSKDEISDAINKNIKDRDHLNYSPEFIFSFCDGIIGKALDICDNENFKALRDLSFNIIELIESGDPRKRISAAEKILETKKVKLILEFFMSYYRDLLLMAISSDLGTLINLDKKDIIQKNRYKLNESSIVNIFTSLKEALYAYDKNANESLLIERLVIKLQEEYNNG